MLTPTALSPLALSNLFGTERVITTACSRIFLPPRPSPGSPAAGPGHAYKVRLPVRLAYLDFTTLAARRLASREELRLNADLAPGVYQTLLTIAIVPDGTLHLHEGGDPLQPGVEAVDVAVRMRNLPESGMLPAILAQRTLTPDERRALVARLADFHARAATGPEIARHGSLDALRSELLGNLDQCRPFAVPGGVIAPAALDRLRDWMAAQLDALAPVLRDRAIGGFVREGHGDLHAGNICFDPSAATPENPTGLLIYDRLEFRLDFRCKDVAAEIACLASSLDAAGHHDLADGIAGDYAALTSDTGVRTVGTLYRAHYAAVRGKVHALQAAAARDARDHLEADHHADLASRKLHQALGYSRGPVLMIACGLPGSGKSHAARLLGPALRARVHRADEIRKCLLGLAPTDRGGPDLYSPLVSARTYAELLGRCDTDLAAGRSVLADATFRDAFLRQPFVALARARGVPLVIVHCHADEAETRRRLEARSAEGRDASDADWAVYEKLAPTFEPPAPHEGPVLRVEPDASTRDLLCRLVDLIDKAQV